MTDGFLFCCQPVLGIGDSVRSTAIARELWCDSRLLLPWREEKQDRFRSPEFGGNSRYTFRDIPPGRGNQKKKVLATSPFTHSTYHCSADGNPVGLPVALGGSRANFARPKPALLLVLHRRGNHERLSFQGAL
jgi:hypothetical protein